MKKTFNEPTKKHPNKPKTSLDVMTSGMREVYNDFYGDPAYIESEWKYCSLQYERALKQSLAKEATFDARMTIRKISTYWQSRRMALEKVLDEKSLEKLKNS